MARFFGSMLAGKAAGMRKALFTNGPGIKTLYASTVVGCTGVYWYLQLNSGTRALTQSRTEPKELETKFSYDGWQMDAEFEGVPGGCRHSAATQFFALVYYPCLT